MGTDAWRNWRSHLDGSPELEAHLDELYSDRQFLGGPTALGPYKFLNVIRTPPQGGMRPALRLAIGIHRHLVPSPVIGGELAPADSAGYHGGTLSDEMAALASLTLGVRLRVAGTLEMSLRRRDEDRELSVHLDVPPLAQPGRSGYEMIPAAGSRSTDLSQLSRLEGFPALEESVQTALVKAARAYAMGLWWANEDPNLAWLQFSTAVEAAAQTRTDHLDACDVIRDGWPEMWVGLADTSEATRRRVCRLLAHQTKATKKFIDFVVEAEVEPPAVRPQYDQLAWENLPAHLQRIYAHRSTALHEGKPFPLPMMERPRIDDSGAVQEIPLGMNTAGLGGIWGADEAPMLLATFEHIVRSALLAWWDGAAMKPVPTTEV